MATADRSNEIRDQRIVELASFGIKATTGHSCAGGIVLHAGELARLLTLLRKTRGRGQ